jgi:hypothetical protein
MYTQWFMAASLNLRRRNALASIVNQVALRSDFLFSKRYIDLFTTATSLTIRATVTSSTWTRSEKIIESIRQLMTEVCCDFYNSRGWGLQDKYIVKEVEGLGDEDRVWIGVEVLRKASEYGLCRDLGATLFKYLVKEREGEDDPVFAANVEEICGSSMQVLFENSFGLAIGNCDPGTLPQTVGLFSQCYTED